jgi:hypothetical protein
VNRDELLASKDESISILRYQLRDEREARMRADTIIAQLTQATSNLTDRLRELEAATDAPVVRESREEAAEEPAEGAAVGRAGQGDTDAPERRVIDPSCAAGVESRGGPADRAWLT